MSDLVERLRKRKAFALNGTWMMLNAPDSDCQEAADRILKLEAALRSIADKMPHDFTLGQEMAQQAKQALEL